MADPRPAYTGDDEFIFVCYAHADSDDVYPEIRSLQDAGFNVWYDEGISPGSEWSDVLAGQIERCAVFLFFVTPRSVEREHCRREINFALEQKRATLAVHLEPTELPRALRLSLNHRQSVLRYQETSARYRSRLADAIRAAARGGGGGVTEGAGALTIGQFTLDVANRRLRGEAGETVLDPKDLSVLLHLADEAPDAVSSEALLARSWPDAVVGDNALHQVIARLRRAFGEDARQAQHIETLPRHGYRLVAPVSGAEAPAAKTAEASATSGRGFDVRWLAGGLAAMAILVGGWWFFSSDDDAAIPSGYRTIVVQEFEDLSRGGDLGWLAGGIGAEIREQLAAVPPYTLVPQAVFERSGLDSADLMLEGAVRGSEQDLTVSLELSDLRAGRVLWARSFTGSSDDPQELQLQITMRMMKYFDHTVDSFGPSVPEAWEPYLKYQHYSWTGLLDQEMYWLEKTLAADPSWQLGWNYYGVQSSLMVVLSRDRHWIGEAQRAEQRLLELQGTEGFDYLEVRGINHWALQGDFDGGERALRRVLDGDALTDDVWYAIFALTSGLARESLPVLRQINERLPYSAPMWLYRAIAEEQTGNLQGARQALDQVARINPEEALGDAWLRALMAMRAGDVDELNRQRQRLLAGGGEWGQRNALTLEALGDVMQGNRESALARATEMMQNGFFLGSAAVYLNLGEGDLAKTAFDKALADPERHRREFAFTRFLLLPVKEAHPHFVAFSSELGYSAEWRSDFCRRMATTAVFDCDVQNYASESSITDEPHSVVVLPFSNLAPDVLPAYLADGLTEELIYALGKIPKLDVSSRTSSFYFRDNPVSLAEIGDQLDVRHAVEGSLRAAGDQVRLIVRLVRIADGAEVTQFVVERPLDELERAIDDVATQITEAFALRLAAKPLTVGRTTHDPQAYADFLQANYLQLQDNPSDILRAGRLLSQVVERDPNFFRAYPLLQITTIRRGVRTGDYTQALADLDALFQKAEQLDPEGVRETRLAELAGLGFVRRDWPALEEIHRTLIDRTFAPQGLHFYGDRLADAGLFEASLAYHELALELDPFNPDYVEARADLLRALGRPEEALAEYRRCLRIAPKRSGCRDEQPQTLALLGRQGELTAALDPGHAMYVSCVAGGECKPSAEGPPTFLGYMHAMAGDMDNAFRYLTQAARENQFGFAHQIRWQYLGGPQLAQDPRYAELLTELGVDDAWQAELCQRARSFRSITGIEVTCAE